MCSYRMGYACAYDDECSVTEWVVIEWATPGLMMMNAM